MFKDINNGHTCYCENCLELQSENDELKKKIKIYSKVNEADTKELIKCKQKLEKIKELCDNPETFIDFFEDIEGFAEKILQIIEEQE